MAEVALFITPNELKKSSNIHGNVDDDKLVQYIKVAQETQIQNYLGTNLYNRLQTLIIAENTTPGSGIDNASFTAYKTLWTDWIKPALVWYSQEAFLPFAMFQVTNGGVYKHRSETGDTITLEEMRAMLDRARSNAEFYTTRLVDYLCDNESSFSEYTTTSADSDMWPDKDTNYSGWVL